MKSRILKNLIWIVALSILMSSCNSLNNMVKKHPTDAEYVQTPNPLEMHNDKVKINIAGEFKPKYFNKKAGMIFQPELQYEGGSLLLKPYALKGEDLKDNATVINYEKGGKFAYTDEIDYKPEYQNAKLIVNPVVYPGKSSKGQTPATAQDALALKKATHLTEKLLANGVNTTPNLVDTESAQPSMASDKYEKETIIPKKATLFFQVDMSNLNLNLPFNKDAQNKQMFTDLEEALNSDMDIKSTEINAWASPEGEESRNDKLSQDRAKTAEKHLNSIYTKVINQKARKLKVKANEIKKDLAIASTAKGEDWDGFLVALRASDIQEKNTIINVVTSQPDKARREQEIRNMTVIYQQIEENILPPLRRAEITINFKEIKKTDEEMAVLSTSNPSELNVEELLYAGTLANDNETKLQVYTSATEIYSDDWRGFNNVAYIQLLNKNFDAAAPALEKANALNSNSAEVLNNLGVVALSKGDFENAKSYFTNAKAQGSAEASKNLAAVNIKEGDYANASSALAGQKGDLNLALSQILDGNIPAAKATLADAPESPKKNYLLAICAARENNEADVYSYLKKTDANLKKQAAKDAEFSAYADKAEFLNAIQ